MHAHDAERISNAVPSILDLQNRSLKVQDLPNKLFSVQLWTSGPIYWPWKQKFRPKKVKKSEMQYASARNAERPLNAIPSIIDLQI